MFVSELGSFAFLPPPFAQVKERLFFDILALGLFGLFYPPYPTDKVKEKFPFCLLIYFFGVWVFCFSSPSICAG